jgi:diaminopimelate epimerase
VRVAKLAELNFTKGHGTANDFIIIEDSRNSWDLTSAQVSWLCDRRRGIGADGVIRVVPTADAPGFEDLGVAKWFMDYRNSDGSVAEMCGNGARVFARYLLATGLETERAFVIATRAGLHEVIIHQDLTVSVTMGTAIALHNDSKIVVNVLGAPAGLLAHGVLVPNPHAVVYLPQDVALADLDLSQPSVTPSDAFPDGVNIEFVVKLGERHLALRVHERGSGETLSCGTGACAVAWTDMRSGGLTNERNPEDEWQIDVPGGSLWVTEKAGRLWLRGPAELVARGKVLIPSALV